jgi:hypothetical protein
VLTISLIVVDGLDSIKNRQIILAMSKFANKDTEIRERENKK